MASLQTSQFFFLIDESSPNILDGRKGGLRLRSRLGLGLSIFFCNLLLPIKRYPPPPHRGNRRHRSAGPCECQRPLVCLNLPGLAKLDMNMKNMNLDELIAGKSQCVWALWGLGFGVALSIFGVFPGPYLFAFFSPRFPIPLMN